jgi:16S rRNA (uracil1498-N3)-methyltransferase
VNPVLRGSAAHVFVDSVAAPYLSDDDEHHLRRVLRIRPADAITVSDGAGSWLMARLEADGLRSESAPVMEAAPRRVVVLSAVPKGDRLEWMVQKLTEVGATAIGFIDCARSVVHWDAERWERQGQRLQRVAREAAMQSRRLWLPEILGIAPVAAVAGTDSAAIADPDGHDVIDDAVDTVLVGPEGGFLDEELALARRRVSLSANVLRVETAAVAAAIMLTLRNEVD